MRKDIEPPEFSDNLLKPDLDGVYGDVRSFNGRNLRSMFTTILEASLLSACLNGPVSPTTTLSPDNTGTTPKSTEVAPTITITPTETPTPKPSWLTAIEIQDPQDQYFKVVDGVPTIDLYDTAAAESVALVKDTIKDVTTNDSLNPDILTAQDAEGNTYAFNPDHGWFALPEVQLDYNKLTQYTQVDQAFIEDGRANITTALFYAGNPTISPDAIVPVYWVSDHWADKTSHAPVPMLCNNACRLRIGRMAFYPEEFSHTFYTEGTKPFAWTGFYKVQLENGESIYVIARTLKNPSQTNTDQTINLFYGYDKKTWERVANIIYSDQETGLHSFLNSVDRGDVDLAVILPPPASLDGTEIPYLLSPNDWITGGNPEVSGLQQRGELISEFDPVNLQIMMQVFRNVGQEGRDFAPLTQPLPNSFSTHILLAGFVNR